MDLSLKPPLKRTASPAFPIHLTPLAIFQFSDILNIRYMNGIFKMIQETTKIGKRGVIVIPSKLRDRFGFQEGSLVIAEEREDGVLIRPAAVFPIERYSAERKAEFLLSNAVDDDDYAQAVNQVRSMGLDPNAILHTRPKG